MMSVADRTRVARERLIGAAIAVIADQGYPATAVGDVIARAGRGRATFYRHFGDLDDCLQAAVDQLADELLVKVRHATEGLEREAAAHGFISALVGYASEERESARVLLLEALGGGPRALARRDRLIAQLEELIDRCSTPAGGDRQVLALLAAALAGGTVRFLAVRLHQRRTDQEELRAGLLAWIDSYLVSPARPASARQGPAPIERPPNLGLLAIAAPSRLPRGGRHLDSREVARNQRERILHATVQAIYQHSYQATTVQDVLAIAGVSERTFYQHFRDLEHAATEINELFWQPMSITASAYFAETAWPRRVWAAGHALTSFFAGNPALARAAFVEVHAISPAAIQLVYDRVGSFTMFLEEGYRNREQTGGLPRLCSEPLAAAIFEYFYRTARRHPAAADLPSTLPLLVYLCIAPFIGANEAADFVQAMTEETERTKAGHGDA